MKRCFFVCICLLLAGLAFAAGNPHAPNIERFYLYQRTFPPNKPVKVTLNVYNLHQVTMALYRVNIEQVIPNAAILQQSDDRRNPNSVYGRLMAMSLPRPVKQWPVTIKHFYPNQFLQQTVTLPKLPSGVYVLEARGGGVVQRTWLAISWRALVVERSPDVVKAWLVHEETGRPVPGVPLALYGEKGRLQVVNTGSDGLATFPAPAGYGPLWVAARSGDPAFAHAQAPEMEKPYRIYLYTDRPVYRPGNLVRFRGTVRGVQRGVYSLPAEKSVRVQIKVRGDVLVYDQPLPLNEWGSFAGEFQLAPEPPLGTYSLEVVIGSGYREYAGFTVETYRKPEFDTKITLPTAHQLGGATVPVSIGAQYFFGSPVSGGKVTYQVQFEPVSSPVPQHIITAAGLGSAAIGQPEETISGQGKLDTSGKLVLNIPTRRLSYDRRMVVSATVTDLSLRSRDASDSMLLTAAQFRLSLSPEKSQYQPGNTVRVLVHAADYDDKPVSTTATVTMIEYLTDREGRGYQKKTTETVQTDDKGRSIADFKVIRPGSFRLEAWARDADRNPVYAAASFYVSKEKPRRSYPALNIELDRALYVPGDIAVLSVHTSLAGGWALLTVEGERLYVSQVQRMPAQDFTLRLPVLAAYQPGVAVRLTVVNGGRLWRAGAELNVPALQKELTVTATPNKAVYQPGETATYNVLTLDRAGRPVPAEVGVGVVDTALYAVRPDNSPNPYQVFWQPQPNRVEMDFSLSASYPGGGYQQVPAPSPPPPPSAGDGSIRVRKLFVDTAYWGPSVLTGTDGRGQITFTVPDNLTTWRATARAMTRETQAGEVRNEVQVTLPLLVRLALPRFYVQQDQATAAAIVHNYTDAERQVKVTMSANGAQVAGAAEQTVTIPAGGIQRLTWKITVTSTTGAARFLVSADGGPGAQDAVENTIPVFPDAVKRVDATAGMSGESTTVRMTLPPEAVAGSAQIELSVSPSLAGPICDALEYLVGYPYGCAEQTMDRFLPDVIVTKTLRELGAQRPEPPMLSRYVNFGVQKLLRYQHADGGWHWWEFDDSDPYMTAYVVYGLALARDAGYPLAAGPLPRGVSYLSRSLKNTPDPAAQTYLLLAYITADQMSEEAKDVADLLANLLQQQDKLDTFSKASLVLAIHRFGQKRVLSPALVGGEKQLADALAQAAVITGTATHWTANAAGGGSWLDSDVEVTAQVLQALLAVNPESPHIVPAIRWLMAARHGKEWNSTKDTAAAVLALTAYLKQAKELDPDETVKVYAGDQLVKTLTFTKAQVFADPVRFAVPATALRPGENILRLEKTGAGNLYWTARLNYLVPAENTVAPQRGIAIKRHYRVVANDPTQANTQPSGSLVEVTVDVIADQHYRYAALEEPIPAGCEIIAGDVEIHRRRPMHGQNWGECYDQREVWDDRLVYYFNYLPKGESSFSYWLRTESPGLYRIRPTTAWLMYFPEVRGEGKLVRMQVTEE
ncbi:MAG: alpha-2-macroglobulin family protein [Armatimonadota bacterium]